VSTISGRGQRARTALALLALACKPFGQTSMGSNSGRDSLYLFASTAVIFLVVRKLPRNGPADWLATGRRSR
jgi:hypothetical protein